MGSRLAIVVMIVLLGLDRALKLIAQKGLAGGWSFFDFYPRLTFHKNYGLAFDLPLARVAIIVITAIILVALLIWLVRVWNIQPHTQNALLFIIAGATSNLFDRVVYGFVIDAIEVFPRSIWNVADIMIVAGLLLLVLNTKSQAPNSK